MNLSYKCFSSWNKKPWRIIHFQAYQPAWILRLSHQNRCHYMSHQMSRYHSKQKCWPFYKSHKNVYSNSTEIYFLYFYNSLKKSPGIKFKTANIYWGSFLFIILMLKLCDPVRRIVLTQSSLGISSSSRQKSNTPVRSWISFNDGDLQGKHMKFKWSSINDVTQFKVSHIYEVILYIEQNYKICSTPNNNLWCKIFSIYEE